MTPEEIKAQELVDRYENSSLAGKMPLVLAKYYAEIAVDEILKSIENIFHKYGIGYLGSAEIRKDISKWKNYQYWQKVKTAIQNL
jgi:hypothetical protein